MIEHAFSFRAAFGHLVDIGSMELQMSEYNIDFSDQLLDAARIVAAQSKDTADGQQTILYLSLLSAEMSLTSLLEGAGVPISEIRLCSHSHQKLLAKLDHCEVKVETSTEQTEWMPVSRLNGITVSAGNMNFYLGTLFSFESERDSRTHIPVSYCNEVINVPSTVMLRASEELAEWARQYRNVIRVGQRTKASSPDKFKKRGGRKRDTELAAMRFCEAYGQGLKVGGYFAELDNHQKSSPKFYSIGYELLNGEGEQCGWISAEYTSGSIGAYAEIVIDDENIETESFNCRGIRYHDKKNNEQPKELKYLIIKLAERAARKLNRWL